MSFKNNNLENKTFEPKGLKISFQGITYTILKRKKQDFKPQFYLLDLENKTYLSSLYPSREPNTYLFDVKDDGKYLLRLIVEGETYKGYEIEEL